MYVNSFNLYSRETGVHVVPIMQVRSMKHTEVRELPKDHSGQDGQRDFGTRLQSLHLHHCPQCEGPSHRDWDSHARGHGEAKGLVG